MCVCVVVGGGVCVWCGGDGVWWCGVVVVVCVCGGVVVVCVSGKGGGELIRLNC